MAHSVNRYAVTLWPTPVFNVPDIAASFGGQDGDTLSLDEQGLLKSVETILFPQTCIQLLEKVEQIIKPSFQAPRLEGQCPPSIWKIRTEEYPYLGNHYVDGRFIVIIPEKPRRRTGNLPLCPKIIDELKALQRTRYIWGGNWPHGIDFFHKFYPSRSPLEDLTPEYQDTWQLKGVDCSGLIYYVSNGYTPRNTSRLVDFGEPIDIEGLSVSAIVDKVKSLDLIVWQGHVVCVLNEREAIESRSPEGVIRTDLFVRLSEIKKERKPVNRWDATTGPRFVVRRWHPEIINNGLD